MIRQRFRSGRMARIGAWALAAVTAATAWLNHQAEAAAVEEVSQGDGPPATATSAVAPAVPAAPDSGLLILRYEPTPWPPPPTIVRRVVVEKPGSGTVAPGTAKHSTSAAQVSPPATAAPGPPPPPAPLPALPPLQSSGS